MVMAKKKKKKKKKTILIINKNSEKHQSCYLGVICLSNFLMLTQWNLESCSQEKKMYWRIKLDEIKYFLQVVILDIMYVEKKVSDNILGTLMNIERKTKSDVKTSLDLQAMSIWYKLHMKYDDRSYRIPLHDTQWSWRKKGFMWILSFYQGLWWLCLRYILMHKN